MKYDRALTVAALAAIPTFAMAQVGPAHVDSGKVNKHIQRSDDVQLPAAVWHDTLYIVDTDSVDSGNGSAISGSSIFGVVYDLSLVDDFESPGGTATQAVHDYLNFNGGGYNPATDYLVEFFDDAGGVPADVANTVITGTSYSSAPITIGWWGAGTRSTVDFAAAVPAGTNWLSVNPVDTTASGDWYYGARQYGSFANDAHGRDGGTYHGSLYGGPYGGGYGVSSWTSMGALGFTAGGWSCQISGGSGGGFALDITGDCNTSFDVNVTGGAAGAKCAFAWGSSAGSTPVPPCPGLTVDIQGADAWRSYPNDVLFVNLDGSGNFTFNKAGGPAFCGKLVQVVDLDNCVTTNVDMIP